ncbi:hypothetical protein CV019_16595 [Staphylococcus haemolyticus]|uniref:Uncharacterized protein n=1 Tax=Staphylococcus haemolyticus TaxID=1283 RepID=A0A7Z1MX63_STAHA|nr:hypothetical protein CV019_16595 [Staphylococcus haemolyticus]
MTSTAGAIEIKMHTGIIMTGVGQRADTLRPGRGKTNVQAQDFCVVAGDRRQHRRDDGQRAGAGCGGARTGTGAGHRAG